MSQNPDPGRGCQYIFWPVAITIALVIVGYLVVVAGAINIEVK